ncbi:7TM diverse intracellular signaling domain-containing protein [Marinomonas sp. IMCC 4694]|uniref:7TMR-DISM family protein n=1 Tax=Marinomonas sp. IMCC 4694 TaxID=2605432 RepID=UPI0011E63A8D|nr:7TM diverse intracellular signaling domain-containing protein [Marinomonas sp. IMCC 4694]TYL48274.1 hypothetical protein FXV75_10170 [Marinomonas sp. IMCC 4694]
MFYRLILLFLLSISNIAWGTDTLAIIDNDKDVFNLGKSGSYFIDESQSLTFEEIVSDQYIKQFRPLNREYLQFGVVKGNVWIRADAAIRTTHNVPVLLEIRSPRLPYLDIYLPNLYGNQVQAELGGARPYRNRQVETPHYVFPLPTNTQPVFTLYLKLSSHLPMNAKIELKTLSKLSQDAQNDFIITGFLVGILLTLLICSVFFFIKTSQQIFLPYGLLLLSIAALHLSLHDQISRFFPDVINIQERIYNLAALSCLCSMVFFSRFYLATKDAFPTLDKVLLITGYINALFAFVFMMSPEQINIFALTIVAISTLGVLTVHAIVVYIKNVPFAGYYLVAHLILTTGYGAWVLSVYGIIPSEALFEWGLTITIIVEAMIHFAGMMAKSTPFLQRPTLKEKHSYADEIDLLTDISSRLRRQVNIIGGGLSHLEQAAVSNDTKLFLASSLNANNNIKNLIERIDLLSDIQNRISIEQPYPQPLNQLIDHAYNNVQRLDQDNTVLEWNISKTDHVEILQNAAILQHLIESLAQEFKHFTDQALTLNITRHALNRDGTMLLELNCSPLPNRMHSSKNQFDLGLHYITLLIDYLRGDVQLLEQDNVSSIHIQLPIRAHVRPSNNDITKLPMFDLILFGQGDADVQKALSILQGYNNKIEHYVELDALIEHLLHPFSRERGTIILVFDNGGHIPHITQQRLMPLMRNEDQCLLISNNVKMSLDYVKKLGFDDLLTCTELESQLEQQLTRLMQKGERLKNASLSRIKPLL